MSKQTSPFENFQNLKEMNITNADELRSKYEELLSMDISAKEKILEFQKKRDHIEKHVVNESCESYFLMTIDVSNEENKQRMEHFDQVINPIGKEYSDKLNTKFLEAPSSELLGERYEILRRNQLNEKEIFSKDNIELNKKVDKLAMEISEIQGKLNASWEGKEIPLPELWTHLESTDRDVRKKASDSMLASELSVSEVIDDKFDELLKLRNEIARNAGFSSYTDYRFKDMQRFDWGVSDCTEFHQAVKKHILPLREKLLDLRKKNLGLDTVKYYDTGVDISERDPLRIYEKGDSERMVEGAGKIIKAIDADLYEYFCKIRDNKLLDLDARENKAPGGYMVMYPVYEQASVFYNGAGLGSDLMVLLHELGHCFHYFLGKDIEPYALQELTPEIAEAGSMSMEYIGLEEAHQYLDAESVKRLKHDKLMSVIGLFTNCSMGDEFQHWLYANPNHTKQMRRDKWKELNSVYYRGIDYDGREDEVAKVEWQYSHILQMPFYLIDYAISELLALTIWDRYKKDPEDAISRYKSGCRLGASKTVSEIYAEFGTSLSFGDDVIGPLAKRLEAELGL